MVFYYFKAFRQVSTFQMFDRKKIRKLNEENKNLIYKLFQHSIFPTNFFRAPLKLFKKLR